MQLLFSFYSILRGLGKKNWAKLETEIFFFVVVVVVRETDCFCLLASLWAKQTSEGFGMVTPH